MRPLLAALHDEGWSVRHIAAEFTYDPQVGAKPAVARDDLYFSHIPARWNQPGSWMRPFWRAMFYPIGHLRLLLQVVTNRPSVVHFQWCRMPFLDWLLVRALRLLGVSVVLTVHDIQPLYRLSGSTRALHGIYQLCHRLLVHSEANRAALMSQVPGLKGDRVAVTPFGPMNATAASMSKSSAREAFGLDAHDTVALFFGAIKPYKGLDDLVAAIEPLLQGSPTHKLLIAGRPDRTDLLASASALQQRFPRQVVIHAGFIPEHQVATFLRAADLAVLPYRELTHSGVLFSTKTYGLPAVVTDVGGLPECVESGATGWIAKAGSRESLSQVLATAFAVKDRWPAMGEAAARDMQTSFTWQRASALHLNIYRQLTQHPGGTRDAHPVSLDPLSAPRS